ncbi:Rne/Rng family ribonuclease [Actinomadura scrupuli]|uniref:Rne/Rng family ribonuclease n=1 Tax=Actinomadura scrupuli TaxID=559629 RepID=UPI003D982C07
MPENEPIDGVASATEDNVTTTDPAAETAPKVTRTRRRAASRPAGPPPEPEDLPAPAAVRPAQEPPAPPADEPPAVPPVQPQAAQTAAEPVSTPTARPAPEPEPAVSEPVVSEPVGAPGPEAVSVPEAADAEPAPVAEESPEPAVKKPARTRAARTRKRAEAPPEPIEAEAIEAAEAADAAAVAAAAVAAGEVAEVAEPDEDAVALEQEPAGGIPAVTFQPPMVVFQPPQPAASAPKSAAKPAAKPAVTEPVAEEPAEQGELADESEDEDESDRPSRRRRRRGGRGRGKVRDSDEDEQSADDTAADESAAARTTEAARGEAGAEETDDEDDESGSGSTRRRRRRRRRTGGQQAGGEEQEQDDPPNTVVHVRTARAVADEVQSVRGSTRLEAKKQRRREGREQGRRRPPIITESEFLARREAVDRVMVVRQDGERTQIAVLEDDILVEHHVDRASHQSYVGNVYLGKVQNVLPSMEAAFVDVGKGRNAVLYAGEVNWDIAGLEGQPRRIESALKSGQSVLVQVTKDPLGHKGARLTSQISLPGRYLVYVPDGSMTGISRKLPDKERTRLKQILKKIMPENAGVIVRTAAEGATEEELSRDVSRLSAQWEDIQRQAKTASAPALLYGEPDLTVRVVRDIFNEDFASLVVSGSEAWDTVEDYVSYVAPHLAGRVSNWSGPEDVFAAYRVDEQIIKALDRKVWLPSGGSLVIDRTEAMTVIDVNTGKFTGHGGNLEETVTRNNLEAAEEIVRQLRLRDIGGIIVVDFIDMVLESNRDLVMRRLLECLSRDRTKHQVAEVTSLGLVQMTRKRVGSGLLENFSETCECCNGRGIHVSLTVADGKGEKPASSPAALTTAAGGRRRKRKGEVEKAVEEKLALHEAERTEDADEPEAPAEISLAVLEPADAEEFSVAAIGEDDVTEPSVTTGGRRRRPRRVRTKAEVDADS